MPYFHNDIVNLLFLHIPKTGGTSLQRYFRNKYNIWLNKQSLYTYKRYDFFNNISFQHQTYQSLKRNNEIFKIDFNNLKIITIVRNPYYRIISDLLNNKFINADTTPDDVYSFLVNDYFLDFYGGDNHRIPQYTFLLDEKEEFLKNITILKTETLMNGMKDLGYCDFDNKEYFLNSSNINKNYMDFLNNDSIKLINEYYEKDFKYFNYKMIDII